MSTAIANATAFDADMIWNGVSGVTAGCATAPPSTGGSSAPRKPRAMPTQLSARISCRRETTSCPPGNSPAACCRANSAASDSA